jgi:beta-glucosidase/6-phospho-beta-glucosidase/beta-galactosidase
LGAKAAAAEDPATEACPKGYPVPYCNGLWPTEYTASGKFPRGFIWGVSTAAYQVEGAYREEGRGASVWDVFTGADTVDMPGANCSYCCKSAPCAPADGMLSKGSTGSVANDHYHMWRSDIALMRSMGVRHYRLSISWPRLIPTGRIEDGVNQMGLAWYNKLIDGLLAAGITPYVTIFHWDLPQGLLDPKVGKSAWWSRDENGVPNGQITDEYVAFADLCFASFGDRVKWWFTFNEPWTDLWVGIQGDLFNDHGRDPWIGGHNVLNAHAAAVDRYRTTYQRVQGGRIGIVLNSDWAEPKTLAAASIEASQRAMAFT